MQNVRGTHDLLAEESARFRKITDLSLSEAKLFGFEEVATPIIEFASVFERTLGDASDIVNKEMYTFEDRGGERITLRPEGTAGIARAFLSNGLTQKLPLKFFYSGPMFRYERPQKGRQRQFHQIGVEILGVSNHWCDVECISVAHAILDKLEVLPFCKLEINSIGDSESRASYKSMLVDYLKKFESSLSVESQKRLQTNPMRILDSKDEKDREILRSAPLLSRSLNAASKKRLDDTLKGLDQLKISYELNEHLVRGLDYYSHVVFEFTTNQLGAQNAVLSGGRYDTLIEIMGGPATPGFGWAAGLERLSLLSPIKVEPRDFVVIVPVNDEIEAEAFGLANQLRREGIAVEVGFSGNLSKRMKKASSQGALAAIIIGPDEVKAGSCQVKFLKDGTQKQVAIKELATHLKA